MYIVRSLRHHRIYTFALLVFCCHGIYGAEVESSPAFTAEQLLALPTDGWITNGGSNGVTFVLVAR